MHGFLGCKTSKSRAAYRRFQSFRTMVSGV
jgi:hypothetical protein